MVRVVVRTGVQRVLYKEAQEHLIWCPLIRVVRAQSSAVRLCLPDREAWQRCSYDT